MKLKAFSAIVACMLIATSHAGAKSLVERLGYPADTKLLIVHADDL
jgi:hypothetical protein